jgi:hypothetical protein
VARHTQIDAVPLFGATHFTGRIVVALWEPSHHGSVVVRPHAHQK